MAVSSVAVMKLLQWKLFLPCVVVFFSFHRLLQYHSFICSPSPVDLTVWLSFLVMQRNSSFVAFILLAFLDFFQFAFLVPTRWMSFMKPTVSKDVSVMVPAK